MAFADIERAILDRFAERWTDTTDFAYDNDRYEPSATTEEWVRLSIRNGSSINAALGGALVRRPGVIIVQVFVKAKTGLVRAMELADAVGEIFENTTFDGVRCYETSAIDAGTRDGWRQVNATTVYIYDEVQAA